MKLGGSAEYFVEVDSESALVDALHWSRRKQMPISILGAGTNLLVSDTGMSGLIIKLSLRGIEIDNGKDECKWTVAAGETWDEVVEQSVAKNHAGLECLSKIPGLVGATPIQNVGAYGQEVSSCINEVRCFDTVTGNIVHLVNDACRFRYRDSLFKSDEPGRYIVLAVTFSLKPNGAPNLSHSELAQRLDKNGSKPSLASVREAVTEIRRRKVDGVGKRLPQRSQLRLILRKSSDW